ncbi:hypothetical protein [Mycobacterium sp. BK086]|uniref:hypothetical protein n=1 Tax=Mycobacterium sp. BK086 TaxID=2512165 RepID=UPI00106228DE|nr:hypothetical protein [Mycobacterium sp. BK086]
MDRALLESYALLEEKASGAWRSSSWSIRETDLTDIVTVFGEFAWFDKYSGTSAPLSETAMT